MNRAPPRRGFEEGRAARGLISTYVESPHLRRKCGAQFVQSGEGEEGGRAGECNQRSGGVERGKVVFCGRARTRVRARLVADVEAANRERRTRRAAR
jgi:hypothetical protein